MTNVVMNSKKKIYIGLKFSKSIFGHLTTAKLPLTIHALFIGRNLRIEKRELETIDMFWSKTYLVCTGIDLLKGYLFCYSNHRQFNHHHHRTNQASEIDWQTASSLSLLRLSNSMNPNRDKCLLFSQGHPLHFVFSVNDKTFKQDVVDVQDHEATMTWFPLIFVRILDDNKYWNDMRITNQDNWKDMMNNR